MIIGCSQEKNVVSSASNCSLDYVIKNGWNPSSSLSVGGNKYFDDVSDCQIKDCVNNFGVDKEGKECVPLTVSCAVANGVGSQSWDSSAYSICEAISCNSGYVLSNGQCVLPPNIYAATDNLSTQQGQTLIFNASQLLTNDNTLMGSNLEVIEVYGAVGGVASLVNGVISFIPSVITGSSAYFFYKVEDDVGNETFARVNLSITPLPVLHALIFDSSEASDISTLLNTVPPTMEELFDEWGRFEESRATNFTITGSVASSALTIPGSTPGQNKVVQKVSRFFNSKQEALDYQNSTYGAYGVNVVQGLINNFWTWFEGLSWSFNSSTNIISTTVNSRNYIGFVSPNKFENYELSANLSSTNNDDDTIALVIAYVRNSTSGETYTLSATRTQGGNTPSNGFGIMYNIGQSDAQLFSSNLSVGGVYRNSAGGNGWSNRYSRVQVIRNGDIIKVMASSWNSDILETSSLIELDLNSDPKLAVFKGPQKYGYAAFSQQNSTFTNISFSAGSNLNQSVIYDFANNKKYDDTLRLVIDCSKEEPKNIISYLEYQEVLKVLEFGYHFSKEAVMTCMVFSKENNEHIHFIDGSGGGYTLAAKIMKEKRKVLMKSA